jgi:hypothetical protein
MNKPKLLEHPPGPDSAPLQPSVEIENIEHMRRCQGIDDERLHREVARLQEGDIVRLTLRVGARAVECVFVRIVTRHKQEFTGELAALPADPNLQRLTDGMTLRFTADHVHSVHRIQDAGTARTR